MAATLGCNTARVLYNAPVAGVPNPGEPSTSSISRLHLRGRRANGGSKKLSLKLAGRQGARKGIPLVRVSLSNEGDKVRELASEKAVESGKQVGQDAKKLANGQSPVVLDAKADDASDAASNDGDVREKVVDVASDMAVDATDDVHALATRDAAPLAEIYGRSVEDTAEGLEAKAAEVSDREDRKESSTSGESQDNSGSFFKDQVLKGNVASTTAVDEGPEVDATAQKDASDMTGKVGGDLRRNKVTIQGLADTASKLEADRSGSQQIGDQIEGLKRTISKNLKEGIDSSRPGLEELSRTASKGVKAGREYLDDAAEGAAEISGDAQNVLDDAKGALDKRQNAITLAVEDARETGSMVAELALKGWDALTKTTERLVANLQKNAGELHVTAQEKAEEAKQKAGKTADQAQSKFAEAQQKAGEAADQAQSKFAEAKRTLEAKTEELRGAAQEKASESKAKIEKAVDEAQRKFNEGRDDVQTKTGELKDTAQEKASESRSKLEEATDKAQSKFGEAKENVQTKTGELKDTAQERASESKSELDDTAEAAQSKAGELSSSAKEKVGDAQGIVESKVGDVEKDLGKLNGQSKGSESSVIGQTPGAEASVQYADSGKVNDEWKGKAE